MLSYNSGLAYIAFCPMFQHGYAVALVARMSEDIK